MKFESFTPSTFATYSIALANAASNKPGCKVKSHHLLEAAAEIEGEANWDALCGRYKKSQPFKFKNELGLFVTDDKITAVDISVKYDIDGFSSNHLIHFRFDVESKTLPPMIKPGTVTYNFLNGYIEEDYCPATAMQNGLKAMQHIKSVGDCVDNGEIPHPGLLEGWSVDVDMLEGCVPSDGVIEVLRQYEHLIDFTNMSNSLKECLSGNRNILNNAVIDRLKDLKIVGLDVEYDKHTLMSLPLLKHSLEENFGYLPKVVVKGLESVGFSGVKLTNGEAAMVKIAEVTEDAKACLGYLANASVGDIAIQIIDQGGNYDAYAPDSESDEMCFSPWGEFVSWRTMVELHNNLRLPKTVLEGAGELWVFTKNSDEVKKVVNSDSALANKIYTLVKLADGGVTTNCMVHALYPDAASSSAAYNKGLSAAISAVKRSKRLAFSSHFGARNIIEVTK